MAKSSLVFWTVWSLANLAWGQSAPAGSVDLRGIALGTDLSAYPRCPPGIEFALRAGQPPCVRTEDSITGSEHFDLNATVIENLPLLPGLGTSAGVRLEQGRVEGVHLLFGPQNFDLMLDALTSKFGKPAEVSSRSLRNSYGALINARYANWQIPGGLVTLEQRVPGSSQMGHLRLLATAYLDRLNAQRATATQRLKDGL